MMDLKQEIQGISDLALFKQALVSVDDDRLLAHVRRKAADIRAALRTRDVLLNSGDVALLERQREWIEKVYGALEESAPQRQNSWRGFSADENRL